MSSAVTRTRTPGGAALLSWPSWPLLAAAALAAVILFIFVREPMVGGWLAAFIIWSQIALGSLALLLIDRLTGNRWAAAFRPYLALFSTTVPVLVLLWIPIVLNLDAAYPWATSEHKLAPDIAAIYLNPPAYTVRSLVAFAGWSFFAALIFKDWLTRLSAGAGLFFYGAAYNLIAYDWILSTDPPFASSAFGAMMAIQNLMAALAAVALFADDVSDEQGRRDLGSFLLASSLAVFYFALMSLIVTWYGNLPDQAAWYLHRAGPWMWVLGAATLFAAIIPILALLFERVRRTVSGLRTVAVSALLGIVLHDLWLVATLITPWSLACFFGSFIVIAVLSLGLARLVIRAELSREQPDG